MGKVATSPLPPRGSPPLQSGGQNQNWPTCAQSGYVTPAVLGIPTAADRGAKSEVAQKWAKWLRHPCRLGDPHRCRARGKIRSGPLVGKVVTSPLPSWGFPPLQSGGGNQKWPTCGQSGYVTPAVWGISTAAERAGGIKSGPQVGKVATSPLPSRGSPPLHSGGQNQNWPTCGQSGYVTTAVWGIPTAAERAGGIKSGPQVGKVATPPLPSRGSPPLHSGGQNQKWSTYGQSGYVTPAVLRIPTAAERGGGNQKWPTCGQSGYVTPTASGIPTASERGTKSELAHLCAKWLRHPCRLGDPHRCRARGKIRSGPLVGKVVTSPLPSWGFPPLQSRGGNQKWPTCGQSGYVTTAVWGISTAAERAGGIKSGPQVGKVATSPLPSRGSPPLHSGGQNQNWPTCGQSGYVTTAVWGIPTAAERAGGIKSGPQVGKVATPPLPSRGSPPLHSGGQNQKWPTYGQSGYVTPAVLRIPTAAERGGGNQKWPTCGQSGYVTLAVSGIPTASERGAKSELAHLWAKWLRHPCRLGDPHRCRAGGKIRSGPQVGKVATSPLPSRGTPPLQSFFLLSFFLSRKTFFFLLSFLLSKKTFLLSSLLSKKNFFNQFCN